jgi:hypothetical protein
MIDFAPNFLKKGTNLYLTGQRAPCMWSNDIVDARVRLLRLNMNLTPFEDSPSIRVPTIRFGRLVKEPMRLLKLPRYQGVYGRKLRSMEMQYPYSSEVGNAS